MLVIAVPLTSKTRPENTVALPPLAVRLLPAGDVDGLGALVVELDEVAGESGDVLSAVRSAGGRFEVSWALSLLSEVTSLITMFA